MIYIVVYLTPKSRSLLLCQEQETKLWVQASRQQAANRINGVIKKNENHSRNFQAVLVTTGVAILQLAGHLKPHPQNKLCFPRGVGVDPPPDPPIKLAESSHTSRQGECLVFWLWAASWFQITHSSKNSSLCTSVTILDHGMLGLSHLSSVPGCNTNRGDVMLENAW